MHTRRRQAISVEQREMPFSGTFSIVARCTRSGSLGVAVASGSASVGDRVPHARPGVGAVATQARTNVTYGIKGLELMRRGLSPKEALEEIVRSDAGREYRQVAMVDARGRKAVFTGRRVPRWSGQSIGEDHIAIGNMLATEHVVDRMAREFEYSSGSLAWRMARALKAASESGGDRRGERSAALIVVDEESVKASIRIDDHEDPIEELIRELGIPGTQGGACSFHSLL